LSYTVPYIKTSLSGVAKRQPCCFYVICCYMGLRPLTPLRVLFREKHPETPKNSNRIRGKKYLQSALKGDFVFSIIGIEFSLDYLPAKMKKGLFEGTAVPSAAPPSLPARLKRGKEMGLLSSL
ncbi:MAG: hypothetical protein ACI3YE_04975, partial [Candidatus Avispirillum sp.]